ncbi:MAG: hypothetical protein LAO18_23265, partial [Acidobacteriia bacterium]|nr:hypothetical protein [Terriglobia bacterium]
RPCGTPLLSVQLSHHFVLGYIQSPLRGSVNESPCTGPFACGAPWAKLATPARMAFELAHSSQKKA